MPVMSLLHRAVSELAELTTFLRTPRFSDFAWVRSARAPFSGHNVRHWVIGRPLPGRAVVDKNIENDPLPEPAVNRLHRAISELVQAATFTHLRS
jgi:hypothetical protein